VNKIHQAVADVARVASVMFDGELCGQIVTGRSWKWFKDFDPNDFWSPHDNYDVEHAPFVAAKHTLMRLEKLAPAGLRVGCNLWVPVPTLPGQITCLVQNGGPNRWQKFGTLHVEISAPMQATLGGQPTDVPADESGIVTVLTPVRDSLKQVAGFIEVSGSPAAPVLPW
jgi:hypothetical protein